MALDAHLLHAHRQHIDMVEQASVELNAQRRLVLKAIERLDVMETEFSEHYEALKGALQPHLQEFLKAFPRDAARLKTFGLQEG